MTRESNFLIYCIEIYKIEKKLTGEQTIALFNKYDVINYVTNYFEALHTTGEKYIINDIDLYIKAVEASAI